MSSYFHIHSLEEENAQYEALDLMLLARIFLREQGTVEIDEDSNLEEVKGPPASKKAVEKLPRKTFNEKHINCPICLEHCKEREILIELPCFHKFHTDCILSWFRKTNSCPVCRHELPTDIPEYEEIRLKKIHGQGRRFRVQALHSAMFG